ncbi:2-iminobutanoate/2-iminopropanoate deaminase [Mortierella sp. GBA35]|nr:2-iminobutanoate/2-iminopropanoate deaminase [Mortierella sp. AD031]KAF9106116.1 2-iminobutanoate/2-iminopropanoate deaminase [Mortierella sp. GBA35]KAG0216751.1 2-iminobutanoate/2-iminopropanoate deaminase [Mortierella sp. NVP41]
MSLVAINRLSAIKNQMRAMSTANKIVHTATAPAAIGPYSQAIVANGFVFCSGSLPVNPANGEVVPGGVKEQAEQVFNNMDEVLKASNSSFDQIVKSTVFLKSMNDFVAVNEVYGRRLGGALPARSCVEVARLPKDVLVEIECIATVSK